MTDTKKHKPWAELPDEIREILSREDTVAKIEEIGRKQGLPPMEQGFLVRISANLMRGIISPISFVNTISDELDINREKAAYLAQEINRDIFSSVKEALQKVHPVQNKPETVAKLDPSLVTCLPGEMSAKAAIANKAPGNAAAVAPIGSIFEQKLGGAFRMKGETVSNTEVITSRQVIPPPVQATRPNNIPVPPPPQSGTTKPALDPYREHPI